MKSYSAELFFPLNQPNRNNRIYSDMYFKEIDHPVPLTASNSLPDLSLDLKDILKAKHSDVIGEVTDIKIDAEGRLACNINSSNELLNRLQEPIKISIIGLANPKPNQGNLYMDKFRLLFFSLDAESNIMVN